MTGIDTPSPGYRTLARRSRSELYRLWLSGETPATDNLAGHYYNGYNCPWWAGVLRIRKFVKAFLREESRGTYGWNVTVRQNSLDQPWTVTRRARAHGYYRVSPVDSTSRDSANLRAILLDYSAAHERRWSVTRLLRDYVVRVQSGSDELLLARAYVAAFRWRIPVAYFVLERRRGDAVGGHGSIPTT